MNVTTVQFSKPDVIITLTWEEAQMLQRYLCVASYQPNTSLEAFTDGLVKALTNIGVLY